MNIWICDTETTGLKQPRGAVEFGLIQIDEQCEILRQYESLVNPGIPIEAEAQAIHKISDSDVLFAPKPDDFFKEIREEGADLSSVWFIAHNANFDAPFYAPYMEIKQQVCTLALARRELKGLPNYKLATVADFCETPIPALHAHTAMGDVLAVQGIVKYLCNKLGITLPKLLERTTKPALLYVMPFGAHKGKLIPSLPKAYRAYLATLDIDRNLRYTLEQLARTES